MSPKMQNVLITGGSGFLGSRLAEVLLERGADATIADVVPPKVRARVEGRRVRFVKCNLTDAGQLRKLPSNPTTVFHLAAFSSPAMCEQDPDRAFRLNVQATYNLLRFCVHASVRKVVFPSASHLYGDHPVHLPIDESHPIDIAAHVYNATKKIGEDLCRAFYENHKLGYVTFRLFNTYGPGQTTGFFVPSIINQAISRGKIVVNNGRPKRDFTYVDDIVDAFVRAGERSFVGGPLNLGTGTETSIASVAKLVAGHLSAELVILHERAFGPMRSMCDNALARDKLGWKPKVKLEEGLAKTIKWYQSAATRRR